MILATTGSADSGAATVTSTWNAPTGTFNWSDPIRWSNSPAANTFPDNGRLGNTYDVVISQGGPVLDTTVTVRSVILSGSSEIYTNLYTSSQTRYAGTNTLSVTNSFTLDSPNLFVNVNAPSGATFTLTNPAKTKLLAAAINIGGEMRLAPVAGAYMIDTVTVGTAVNLLPTSLFTIDRPFGFAPQSNDPFQLPVNGTMNNAGVIQQTAAGTFTGGSWWKIENSGTIHVNGTFNVPNGFRSTGLLDLQSASGVASLSNCSLAGQVTLAAGSALTIGGAPNSPVDVLKDLAVTNAGAIQVLGTTYITSPVTISGPGSVSFPTNGRSVNLQAPLTLNAPTVLDGAEFSGTYRASVSNLTFKSGRITGSELFVSAGGTLMLSGTNTRTLNGATVTVAGNAVWDGGILSSSATRFQILSSGTLILSPSATASFVGTTPGGGQPLEAFANGGLMNIDHASFTLGVGTLLDNSGTLRVTAGSMTLSGLSVTNSGTVDLQPGATLIVNADPTAFNQPARFTITSTGTLHVAAAVTATFNSSYSDRALNNAGLLNVDGGRLNLNSWGLNNSGTLRASAGTIQVTGVATNSGLVDIAGANIAFSGDHTFNNTATGIFQLGPGATASFGGASFTASLLNAGLIDVNGGLLTTSGISNSGTIRVTTGAFKVGVSTRNFTNTGSIDLRSGAGLVFAPDSTGTGFLDKTRAMIVSGRNGGAWNGAGIQSATAQTSASSGVGYDQASSTFTWMGVIVRPGDILVRQTLLGDANLDGVVDFNDLVKLAQNYNAAVSSSSISWWNRGDFNYDGTIDFNDLVKLAQNYNTGLPAIPLPGATASFDHDLGAAFATVPEPAALIPLLATGALALVARRCRHRGA